jgi:WD40 repeat protein
VLYELLSGRPPFQAPTALETLRQITAQEPVRLRQEVPRPLEIISLKCLEKEPGWRYGSARELLEDLERWLAGQSIQGRPVRVRRYARWCRRNRLLTATIGLVVLLSIGGLIGLRTGLHLVDAATADQRAREEREAAAQALRERRQRYVRSINDAYSAWQTGDYEAMRERLASCRPDREAGEEDLRDFEWCYLAQLAAWGSYPPVWHYGNEHEGAIYCAPPVWAVGSGHQGEVYCARWISGPTGCIFTGGQDGTIQLWEISPRRHHAEWVLRAHSTDVNAIAIAPDVKLAASACDDGTVALWDMVDNLHSPFKEIVRLHGHQGEVVSVAFSPDSKMLATGGKDGLVKLWDVDLRQATATFNLGKHGVEDLAFRANGKALLVAAEGLKACSLDGTGTIRDVLAADRKGVRSLAVNERRGLIATGFPHGLIELLDADSYSPLGSFHEHEGDIESLAFDSLRHLASGSRDGTIRVWDARTGTLERVFRGHKGRVWSVAFNEAHAHKGASTGEDGKVVVWSVPGHMGSATSSVVGPYWPADRPTTFAPGGRWNAIIGVSGKVEARTHEGMSYASGFVLGPSAAITMPVFSPDGSVFAVGTGRGSIELWSAVDKRPLPGREVHKGPVTALAFHPDGHRIATSAADVSKGVKIWDMLHHEPLAVLDLQGVYADSMAFSPDGKLLALGRNGGQLSFWEPETGNYRVGNAPTAGPGNDSLVFSTDGAVIATSSGDGSVWITDVASGQVRQSLPADEKHVCPLAFSPDGKTLAVGCTGKIRLFHMPTGQEFFSVRVSWQARVDAVAFLPDGRTLLSDCITRKGEHEMEIHRGPIDEPVQAIEE